MTVYMPDQFIEFEPSPRWVRVCFNDELIADSRHMMLLRASDHLPIYFFPCKDVRSDVLHESDHRSRSETKGEGVFWHVCVGDRTAENAAFSFRNPPEGGVDLSDYIAFQWDAMDTWFEEDEEVFVHPRDPHKRVDVIPSSRHIKVMLGETTLAYTHRPYLLFETGLPVRYYLPLQDVKMELLEDSDTLTRCPYKGEANYYSIRVDGRSHPDLVWYYRYPTVACARLQGLVCFYSEKVDIYEDGELLSRLETPWS